jgi:competence protein ComEA
MLKLTKQEQYVFIVLILAILSGGGILVYKNSGGEVITIIDTVERVQADEIHVPPSIEDEVSRIYVHVSGAVKSPGVYALKEGARIYEAIELAGGLAEDADEERLNLAQVLRDAQKVYVPVKGGSDTYSEDVPQVQAGGAGLVDINSASVAVLATLPGIGKVLAERIVEYRRLNGPFERKEDLMKVSGIGQKKFEGLEDLIIVF